MTPAVWFSFRAELRGRWRAWLGLAMLIGIAAGVVIAAAAGVRRTDTAYARFLHDQRAFDVVVFPQFCPGPADLAPGEEPYECDLTAVAGLPQVEESVVVSAVSADVRTAGGRSLQPGGSADYTGPGEVNVVGSADGRFGSAINRLHVVEGRLPDPREPDEVALSQALAERANVGVGDILRAALNTASEDSPSSVPIRKTWRVVGIEVAPFEIEPPSGDYLAVVHVTPAALRDARRDGAQVQDGAALRLVHGDRDAEELQLEMDKRRIRGSVAFRQADQAESVERAIRPDVAALALVAALAGLSMVAVFGAVLARQAWTEAAGYATLWSLGLRRRELASLTLVRAAAIGLIAAPIAALTGFLVSPLTPIGLARDAEPDPGFAVDTPVLLAGGGLTLFFVVGLVLWPAWRIARVTSTRRVDAPGTRPSAIATALARAAFPPPALVGVRMALEPGRGSTAVPVRTGFVGATAGVLAVAAALAFSASLTHLTETPSLIGFNWEAAAYIGSKPTPVDAETRRIERIPGVAGATPGLFFFEPPFPDTPLLLGPDRAPTVLLAIGPGVVGPSVIAGRAPVAPDEILLGTETLDELGLEIGQTVTAVGQVGDSDRPDAYQETSAELRVVGTGAVPAFPGGTEIASRLGRGAVTTLGALRRLNPVARPDVIYVRFADGADHARVRAALRREVDAGRLEGIFTGEDDGALEGVLDVERIDRLPLILAALVALVAACVVAHVLLTSVRSRRREIAVLRALGFRRRQVRGAVVWEAVTVAIVALVIGLPVGIVAGRLAWELYAESIGVVPEAVVSGFAIAFAAVGALVVAIAVAVWPGRAAVRTRPGPALRNE